MKTSALDRIPGLVLRSVFVLALVTSSCCFVTAPGAMLSPESLAGVGSAPPGGLAEINIDCWDAASLALVESQRMHAVDGMAALWDFMTRLSASPQPQHQELFMKIARAFWKRYVKCVLSRTHGLGRRRSGVSGRYRQLWFWCPMPVFHVTKNCLLLLLLIMMIMIMMMMLFLCILSTLQSWLLIENNVPVLIYGLIYLEKKINVLFRSCEVNCLETIFNQPIRNHALHILLLWKTNNEKFPLCSHCEKWLGGK